MFGVLIRSTQVAGQIQLEPIVRVVQIHIENFLDFPEAMVKCVRIAAVPL
ncbi:hypothetical protein SB782_13370 [Brevibacillus sp. SIMBA_076]